MSGASTRMARPGVDIPERMRPALVRWVVHGILPGDFLQAVLRNDLRASVELADSENLRCLPAFVIWLYNEAPGGCWGSPAKVAAWPAQVAQSTGAPT